MPFEPVPDMGPRLGLVVASNAKVLLMTCHAALAVAFRHEPVAQRAPGVRMVARLPRVMTGNAIIPLVTGETGFPALARLIEVQIGRCAMKLDPVPLVRIRPGERNFAPAGSRHARLHRWCVADVFRLHVRAAAHQARRGEHTADDEHCHDTDIKNHSASPV